MELNQDDDQKFIHVKDIQCKESPTSPEEIFLQTDSTTIDMGNL